MAPGRRHRPLSILALGLSLWMALPSLEWCPFAADAGEAPCAPGDLAACGTPFAVCKTAPCDAGADAPTPCGTSCEGDNATAPESIPGACDPTPDRIPFGDRAWCVHPPLDGVVVRPLDMPQRDAAPLLATLAPASDMPAPVAGAPRVAIPLARSPVLASPHAPPLARAPPLA